MNAKCFVSSGNNGADSKAKGNAQRIVLVMFLGGCTFSEISALRFLGREKGKHLSASHLLMVSSLSASFFLFVQLLLGVSLLLLHQLISQPHCILNCS